ncbi:hypothetical protein OCZ42_004602 [Salmonella enterica]|nr:hypothetical protein [Salmonella enterica]ECP1029504.1 hypothetical protein [Salmonella enterica]ECV2890821.1 hypothetical protein [Salmonella enterica]EGS2542689.1 hypothetical protein [Salmonella enterica]EID9742467.1 hypothetical protein [Salmonella enterica]
MLIYELGGLDLLLIAAVILLFWSRCSDKAKAAELIRAKRYELQYYRIMLHAEQQILDPIIQEIEDIRRRFDFWDHVDGY